MRERKKINMSKKGGMLVLLSIVTFCLCSCGGNSKSQEESVKYIVDGKELSEKEYQEYIAKQEETTEETTKQEETTKETTQEVTQAELTEAEKAAIYAVQCLKSALKNPHSLELYSIKYKRGNNIDGDYFIKVEYAADNNFGGKVEDTFYYKFDLDLLSEDSKKVAHAMLFGCGEVGYSEYDLGRRSDYTETEVDIERVLNNIDIVLDNTEG